MSSSFRVPSEAEYCHERLGERFASSLSHYDTRRRVEVLVDDFLAGVGVRGKRVLDVGCGLGFFSERLAELDANVTACDIGQNLVEQTRRRVGCNAQVADALRLIDQFGPDAFDAVVSSECIEHTPDPGQALRQMVGVLRPGGFIAFSTPNILWAPVVRTATALRLRPFDGHENFSSWHTARQVLRGSGVTVVREHGLHLFPFQLKLHSLSRWCDRKLQRARAAMINICILGRKNHRGAS